MSGAGPSLPWQKQGGRGGILAPSGVGGCFWEETEGPDSSLILSTRENRGWPGSRI